MQSVIFEAHLELLRLNYQIMIKHDLKLIDNFCYCLSLIHRYEV